MSVKLKEILAFMEKEIPQRLAEEWDNTGLAVGNPEREVKKVLIALDVTEEVIEEAIRLEADLIVTHHPMLLFQKVDKISTNTPLGRRIYGLIENGIAAFSAHTNLDIVKGGTNDVLADRAGLIDVEILEETWVESLKKLVVYVPKGYEEKVREGICTAGAGHIGGYSHCTFSAQGIGTFYPLEGTKPFLGQQGALEKAEEIRLETIIPEGKVEAVVAAMLEAHPYEEVAYDIYGVEQKGRREGIGRIGNLPEEMTFRQFSKRLKEKLGLDAIRLVGDGEKRIRRVGLCSGSGVSLMAAAKKQGADAYLTGDIKYHEAQKALEMDLAVADVTHYAGEVIIVPVLQQMLKRASEENRWELKVYCSQVNGQTFWNMV